MAEGEGEKRKDRPYSLPFFIALGMWAWLSYLFFSPEMLERAQFTFSEWVTIGYLVTMVMLTWLVIWKFTLNTEVTPEPVSVAAPAKPRAKAKRPAPEEEEPKRAPAKRKKRVVVAKGAASAAAEELPEGLHRPDDVIDEEIEDMPRVIEYPDKEPGGVYSDTLVQVDENQILNLRVLLGKVCHNCEELEDCKRRVEGKLDEEVLLFNFECKDGLKGELQKARKKREMEKEKAEVAKEMVEEKAAAAKPAKKKAPPKKKGTIKRKAVPKKRTPSKGTKKSSSPEDKKEEPKADK